MAPIYLQNYDHHLTLNTVHLPSGSEITTSSVGRSPISRKLVQGWHDGPEDALAWRATASAQRRAAYHGYNPLLLELETIVLSPSVDPNGKAAPLNPMFDNTTNTSDERLVIYHGLARYENDAVTENLWPSPVPSVVSDDKLSHPDFRGRGYALLEQVLAAYENNAVDVEESIWAMGHPYWTSRGFAETEIGYGDMAQPSSGVVIPPTSYTGRD